MRVEVIATAKEAQEINFNDSIAVVIDVLRATTVIVTAFENGVDTIYPFGVVEEAVKKYEELNKKPLLCGERNGIKIDGFDLGNSPLEFTNDIVSGKILCMTTTNGTRAIKNCITADRILIGCFLNVQAIAKKLVQYDKKVYIVCSGTNDKYSLDDCLCAGYILNELSKLVELELDDFALSLKKLAEYTTNIKDVLVDAKHYKYLDSLGNEKDLEYCIKLNTTEMVPYFSYDKLIRG